MDRHTCIIIDRSNGEPLGFSFVSSVADPTVAELLDNIKSGRPTAHNLAPSSVLYALPPEMATRQTSVRNLRRIRADWRQVMEDCTAHYTAERISKIREAGKYSEDQVFMLSYCDVIEPERPIESNLYTVQEENLDCRGRIMPLTRPQAAVVESIRRKIKPPSTSNTPRGDLQWPPADLTGPSIAIYHPIFAKFQRGLSQTPLPGDISREDLDSASSFISLSTQYYTTEPERQYAISSVVEALLCPSFVFRQTCFRCGIISFEPDGHRLAKCGLFKRLEHGFSLMLSLIAEVRNGIGLGESDPIEQAEKAYLIVATAPERPVYYCLWAIYVDGVITERLTDFISLVPVLSPQAPLGYASAHDKLTYQIAHLFQCLRECLDQLAAEYLKMDPMDIVDERILLPAPHFSSFSNAHHEYKLTYLHRLFPSRSERTVFFAEAETVGQPVIDCIVKLLRLTAQMPTISCTRQVRHRGSCTANLYHRSASSVCYEFVHEQGGALDTGGYPDIAECCERSARSLVRLR
ncbi:hypothetical protein IMY05_C4722000100 [Salix suchowensis]|nr:hypothetical protein IMY05_C4722000100 [Salix suchowensis]